MFRNEKNFAIDVPSTQRHFFIVLDKHDFYFFIGSCVSQIYLWSINPGVFDLYKYILCAVSFILMSIFLSRIWNVSPTRERNLLFLHVFTFTVFFNFLLWIITKFLGGILAIIIGVADLLIFIRIKR